MKLVSYDITILDDFAEELKEIRATAREDYYYETHGMSDDIDEAYEKAIQALTSWKDKEVMAAYRQGYNDNSRDCYCDSPGATEGVLAHRHLMDDGESHNIKPDVESLQSQGGKKDV